MTDAARDFAPTFPLIFEDNARRYSGRPAIREKDLGVWQTWNWAEAWAQVRDLAHGLAARGFRRGDRVAIIGDNRPQLYWAMTAAQALGGVPVPLYQDSIESEMQFIIDHSEARFAVVEDQEQVDKLVQLKESGSRLEAIFYEDPRGLRNYKQPYLARIEAVQAEGREFEKTHAGWLDAEMRQGRSEDLAVICYTSGTTGKPKGVMLTHKNFIETARHTLTYEKLRPEEQVLAYLPMAWVGDFFLSFALAIAGRFTVNCPENGSTVMGDLREIGPTYFFAPPRIWETIYTNVMIRMEEAAWFKRRLFHHFLGVAQRIHPEGEKGGQASLLDRLIAPLGHLLVYGPLKDNLGMSRIRIAYTAGEAMGPELFTFYRALGINLKQLYGQTEASVFVSLHVTGDVAADTVGPPVPWVELKVSDTGEVLFRGQGAFVGYYKNEEATRQTMEGGWVKTGDAGFVDHRGHLKIIDRVKDVGRTGGGTLFAPKYIENKLKFSPYVKEAVAIGRDRPFVTAMINIDLQAVGNWAEKRGITYTSYTDLAQKPEVYQLIAGEVARVNAGMAQDEQLRGAQIRKFLILHKELDPDDQEITRTRKLRRGFIEEKYQSLVEGLYSGAATVNVDAKVTFEDGRTASMRAEVKIADVGGAPERAA